MEQGNYRTAFGQRLDALLAKKGIPPKTLAAATGMHISIVYYYIKGQRLPSTPTIFRLAKALDMPPVKVFAMIDPEDCAAVSAPVR